MFRRLAKEHGIEGAIVAFADYLAVIAHLWMEVSCANMSVMQHYVSLIQYAHTFDHERFDVLRPLIEQSSQILYDICMKAKDSVGIPEGLINSLRSVSSVHSTEDHAVDAFKYAVSALALPKEEDNDGTATETA